MKVKDLMRALAKYDPDFDVRVRRPDGSGKYDIANHIQVSNFGYFGSDTRLDNFNSRRKTPDAVVIVCDVALGELVDVL